MVFSNETLGQRNRAVQLLLLAREEFGSLKRGEVKMLRGAASGQLTNLASKPDDNIELWHPPYRRDQMVGPWQHWGDHRAIRASVLRWLCTVPDAKALVDPRGITLYYALIQGELDLDGAQVPFITGLFHCSIPEGLTAMGAQMHLLALDGSMVAHCIAGGIKVTGSINLRDGFRALGEVRLMNATVGGTLDCQNAYFERSDGVALHADSIKVTGSINLRDGFRSMGEVRLLGSTVGGDLSCGGGLFEGSDGNALSADGIKVSGNIFFSDGFRAMGEVRLLRSAVGRNLSCKGGMFERRDGNALSADGIKVSGDIFFSDGFRALGGVRLPSATVGGTLSCTGGLFENCDGVALNSDGIKVTGNISFFDGFRATGEIRLRGAIIGGSLACAERELKEQVFRLVSGSPIGLDKEHIRHRSGALVAENIDVGGVLCFHSQTPLFQICYMTHASVGCLSDQHAAWPKCMVLTGFRYGSIHTGSIGRIEDRLDWLGRNDRTTKSNGSPDFLPDPQPYKQLARVLHKQGHESNARLVMRTCARRRALARFENQINCLSSARAKQVVAWSTAVLRKGTDRSERIAAQVGRHPTIGKSVACANVFFRGTLRVGYGAIAGHGYSRWRPLYWMVALVLLGALVFSDGDPADIFRAADVHPGGMQQTQSLAIRDTEQSWIAGYPVFRPLAYSADSFLPLVNLHQESYWTPKDGFVKSVYLPLHILSGWIVTTLAAISITGLVRNERQ